MSGSNSMSKVIPSVLDAFYGQDGKFSFFRLARRVVDYLSPEKANETLAF